VEVRVFGLRPCGLSQFDGSRWLPAQRRDHADLAVEASMVDQSMYSRVDSSRSSSPRQGAMRVDEFGLD
jgi:hypothetical protein